MKFRYLLVLFLSTIVSNLFAEDKLECISDSTTHEDCRDIYNNEDNECKNDCTVEHENEYTEDCLTEPEDCSDNYNNGNECENDCTVELGNEYTEDCVNNCINNYVSDCKIFKTSLEFLYFKPCIERNECAFRESVFIGDETILTGHYENWEYSWRPSFRIYLGTDVFCGTLAASYQFLNNKSSSQFDATDIEPVLMSPISSNFISSGLFFSFVATHEFNYHHFDLFFEQPFDLYCFDLLIPYVGIEGLVLNQKVHLKGQGINIEEQELGVDPGALFDESQSANYWGLGLKAGSTLLYALNSCFDLFAQVGASIIYGPLDEKFRATITSNSSVFTRRTTSLPNLLIPSLKLRFGFDFHVSQCACPFTARIGYEFIEWFNIWSYRTDANVDLSITQPNRSNFQLNGLTLGVLVVF